MKDNYIPKQKDIIYVNLNPTLGHEQKGLRPVLVISSYKFNKYNNICIILPISTNNKYFKMHYKLNNTKSIHGSVCCEHIRSIDYQIRKCKYIESIDNFEFNNIINIIKSITEV